jgi:DNA-binding transcriptional regulator LsrR (DeoR family)
LASDVNRFNGRMIAADSRHRQAIPHILAVAGRARKLPVIWTVSLAGLQHPSRRAITALCTDVQTANELLALLHEFHPLPENVRDWYARVTAEIF